jgi:hypothetical protein
MALYYQLSTQNVITKFLSVSSITGGNSVNSEQLASTVASLAITSVVPANLSTQAITTSSITASTITSQSMSTLVLYASSIIGVTTGGGLATIPSTLSSFAILTSSIQLSTATAITLSAQQLFVSSVFGDTLVASNLFVSSATLSTFSTNSINFAGGFGYLTMPDIYPNTVYTSTVTTSNLLVGINSVVSPVQFYGFGNYTNSVLAELSTGGTTQELLMFRGSNATDRIRFQTTGSLVFEPGVSARLWPTVPSNATPAMVINTSSNVGIQTASPGATLDVAGTGRFQIVSTLNINLSSINGQTYTAGGGLSRLPSTISSFSLLTSSLTASTITTSSLQVNSLVIGTGTGWVNLGPLQTVALSTIQVNANDGYINNLYVGIQSTVNDIAFNGLFGNYNNTVLAEISTGAGTQELLVFKGSSASDRVRVQTTGTFVIETGVSARLFSTNTLNTLSNATPSFTIDINSNVGIQTASPGATLDVAGTGRFQIVSTLALRISSINGEVYSSGGGGITTGNLTSTVAGLGQIYLSTGGGGGIASIPANLSTSAFFTSSLVASTATILIMSSLVTNASTITTNLITTSSITTNAMTLGTTPTWILTSPIQTLAVSTNTLWADVAYINSNNVTTEIASTITTNALTLGTGATWILTSPIQTSIVSSIYLFASQPFFDTVNVGVTSTMNSIEYSGLFSNYNNTVLAEISTGGGTQEFLIFKGSSSSDRVRVQTTGNFVVETGVSARLFNSNTTQTLSNATPAFIINTSSNVGIQTASPGATLDVAGTGRFMTLSSMALNISSINGSVYSPGGGGGITTANLTSSITGLGSAGYLSSFIFAPQFFTF